MGRAIVGVGKSKVFHQMFIVAQSKGQDEATLDGIVNQWAISKAMEIDKDRGSDRAMEISLRGNLLSPRYYLYGGQVGRHC